MVPSWCLSPLSHKVSRNVNITNNTISGGNLEPYSESYAFRLIMDIDPDTEYSNTRRRGGRKLPSLNKQPNARVIIEYNVFKNFAGYNPLGLTDQDTKESYNTTIQECVRGLFFIPSDTHVYLPLGTRSLTPFTSNSKTTTQTRVPCG